MSAAIPTSPLTVPSEGLSSIEYAIQAIFGSKSDIIMTLLHTNDVESTLDCMALDLSDFESMVEHVPDNTAPGHITTVKMSRVQIKKLIAIQSWVSAQPSFGHNAWYSISQDSLESFLSSTTTPVTPSPSTPAPAVSSMYPSCMNTSINHVADFHKTVKVTISDYPKLKNDRFFTTWKRNILATAAAHGMSDVLDPHYTPMIAHEQDVFKAKDTFMYNVMCNVLQTARAKKHVRIAKDTQSGHEVFKSLLVDYTMGTSASVHAEAVENELRSLKITNSYNKPISCFLDMWDHKVLDLEDVTDTPLVDSEKRKILTSAIWQHNVLYEAVSNTETLEHTLHSLGSTSGDGHLPFSAFHALVCSRALVLDSNCTPFNSTNLRINNSKQSGKHRDKKEQKSRFKTNKNSKWWIDPDKWKNMTHEEHTEHLRKKHESRAKNDDQSNGTKEGCIVNTATTNTHNSSPKDEAQHNSTVVQHMLSNNQPSSTSHEVKINGMTYVLKSSKIKYSFHNATQKSTDTGSLIDGGANGGLSGTDV